MDAGRVIQKSCFLSFMYERQTNAMQRHGRDNMNRRERAHNKCGERKKATPTNEMTMKNKEISAQKLCAGTVSLKQAKDTQGGRAFTTYCRLSSATIRACEAAEQSNCQMLAVGSRFVHRIAMHKPNHTGKYRAWHESHSINLLGDATDNA